MGVKAFLGSRSLKADDSRRTAAAELTLRQSILPLALVTVLFFLWGFSYGLLDTLNKHFQTVLNVDRARSSGLQAAYFGCASPFLFPFFFRLLFLLFLPPPVSSPSSASCFFPFQMLVP